MPLELLQYPGQQPFETTFTEEKRLLRFPLTNQIIMLLKTENNRGKVTA